MNFPDSYDVLVIGGGHAGVEACLAAARKGARTLLLTQNANMIGALSCNPSIGGIGKGHLVKEIDALGGAMALACDYAGIHFKILNASKGPAVQATRAQLDRNLYKQVIRSMVESMPNLFVFSGEAADLIVENNKVTGVLTTNGYKISAKSVVLATGTFLGGRMFTGLESSSGGRNGCAASNALALRLRELNLPVGRLKTGTPARLDGRTIDYSVLEAQYGDGYHDGNIPVFSGRGNVNMHPKQVACYITHTNTKVHDILRSGFDRSPMFTGVIEGVGPRYCPSIEDKINRFSHKQSHQIFLEPEGLNTFEVYPNGISTSLPFDIQYEAIRAIKGLEKVHILSAGYAIEYDYFDPMYLKNTMETKAIENLFFAGQINGTTGYEEAASQGLLAGINAAARSLEQESFVLDRTNSYLGVLVDDLISRGVTEPYRMFTSRSEYRLSLREDNADERLTEIGYKAGVVGQEQYTRFMRKKEAIEKYKQKASEVFIAKTEIEADASGSVSLEQLLKRPEISWQKIDQLVENGVIDQDFSSKHPDSLYGSDGSNITKAVEIFFKYEGYIKRQSNEIVKVRELKEIEIPADFDYDKVPSLTTEVVQKLKKFKPQTIAQASAISGVPPSAISILLIMIKKRNNELV